MNQFVSEPEHLKFKYETAKKNRPKESIDVQTENERSNMAVFLTVMTLPMQAETWLIKLPKLPWSDKGHNK